jgi:hypothetical protein
VRIAVLGQKAQSTKKKQKVKNKNDSVWLEIKVHGKEFKIWAAGLIWWPGFKNPKPTRSCHVARREGSQR